MLPSVDVVVVTSNAREIVLECLDHLRDPEIARIIVVDNASSDATAEVVRAARPDVVVVLLKEHGGLSRAFNRGTENATAEYVLFLNDDIFAEPESISRLRAALDGEATAVSAGGRLVDFKEGRTQDAYQPRAFPTVTTFVAVLTGLDAVMPRNPWSGKHLRKPLDDETIAVVDQPAGAALMVRRAALQAVGGWDERYWFWYEDVDLSRRLAREGVALYVPTAPFRHIGGATVGRWSTGESLRRIYHGVFCYAAVHFSRRQQIVLGLVLLALSIPRVVLLGRRRPEVAELHRSVTAAARALISGRRTRIDQALGFRKTAV